MSTGFPAATEDDHTALMRAALEGRTEAVKALLSHGAKVNAKDREGRTALMFAAINLHADTVRALLDHGADVNAKADDGGTALMLAVSGGDTGIVQALLDRGADVREGFTRTGMTALTLASMKNLPDVVKLLMRAGAKNN